MIFQVFKDSLAGPVPPNECTELQKALWYCAKGNWEAAHNIAQQHEGEKDFDRLHAFLHREEGDEWNAHYWYRRAGTVMPGKSVKEELEDLIQNYI